MSSRFRSFSSPALQHAEAALVLSNGAVFYGYSFGAPTLSVGELVFNTSMTGYQEIITDPSYLKQIVVFTYPHIGNCGVNSTDKESEKIFASGLVVKDYCIRDSNWRSTQSLKDYLLHSGTPAIAGVDTRKLTQFLRTFGAQNACLIAASPGEPVDIEFALSAARSFPGLSGVSLLKEVSTSFPFEWAQNSSWSFVPENQNAKECDFLDKSIPKNNVNPICRVVAYDLGVKRSILNLLTDLGCSVLVVPASMSFQQAMSYNPHGIFLSNGPGDPEPCVDMINAAREFVEYGIPVFGICLGHQILALASGAKTCKMKFGHHGSNHPVQDEKTKEVFITSQNHGFTVDPSSLPSTLEITHSSLFDGSIQGLRRIDKPVFSLQGHPEASPGPRDMCGFFQNFITEMMVYAKTL